MYAEAKIPSPGEKTSSSWVIYEKGPDGFNIKVSDPPPPYIPDLLDLPLFIAEQQEKCFKVPRSENIERISNLLVKERDDIVALAIAWSSEYKAIGSALIQKENFGNGIKYWIHEVCKTGQQHKGEASPISTVIELLQDYVYTRAKSVWLLVEMKPDHGFGGVLNNFYFTKGFVIKKKMKGEIRNLKGYTIMERNKDRSFTEEETDLHDKIRKLTEQIKKDAADIGIKSKDLTSSIINDHPKLKEIQDEYEKLINGIQRKKRSHTIQSNTNKRTRHGRRSKRNRKTKRRTRKH